MMKTDYAKLRAQQRKRHRDSMKREDIGAFLSIFGLTFDEAAPLLGSNSGAHLKRVYNKTSRASGLNKQALRLLGAYMDGYRPSSWPRSHSESDLFDGDLTEAKHKLRLNSRAFAYVMGYTNVYWTGFEEGKRKLSLPARLLLQSYLEGYRPDDWPGR